MMQQTIQKSRYNDRILKQFSPVGKSLVGCDNRAGLFIPVGNKPKKEITFLPVDRRVTHLVHNHQRRFIVTSASALPFSAAIFFQFTNQVFHRGKIDAHSSLAGLKSQGNGQMGLPYAGRPQKDHIAFLTDKRQIEQGHNPLTIQPRLEGKIKLVDTFDKRKTGDLDGRLHAALFPAGNLFFQKVVQKGQIAFLLLLGRLHHAFEDFSHSGKPQANQTVLNAIKNQGVAHSRTSSIVRS